MGSFEVRHGDGTKALLASGIPYLKLHLNTQRIKKIKLTGYFSGWVIRSLQFGPCDNYDFHLQLPSFLPSVGLSHNGTRLDQRHDSIDIFLPPSPASM